jgi:BirA family transcriptional regulator, biotin operon repressor / biotin---[acetyl-CoA-carboxylase] ligase
MEEWSLPHQHIGKYIQFFDCTDSTNSRAAALAGDPHHHGTVIAADRQTAGRGQYGRVWQCPPGSGILMSVLLFPPATIRRPALMTALAAVAVGETILKVAGIQAKIKWPNDLLLHGRKVCGILIEQGQGVVIGIGLNINQTEDDFREMGLPDATSLGIQTSRSFDARQILHELILQLDTEYDALLEGELTTLEACWKWRIGLLGRWVTVEKMDGTTVEGRLMEMTSSNLQLVTHDGTAIQIVPELIRHLRPAVSPDEGK